MIMSLTALHEGVRALAISALHHRHLVALPASSAAGSRAAGREAPLLLLLVGLLQLDVLPLMPALVAEEVAVRVEVAVALGAEVEPAPVAVHDPGAHLDSRRRQMHVA